MSRFDFLTPEFIKKHCRPVGIKVRREVFPWRYLGMTDDEFMAEAEDLHYGHGPAIPGKQQRSLLGIVRIEEEKLLEIHKFVTDRERVMGPAPVYKQLELFK